MMKKLSISILIVILLSGCWDVDEADRMDYAHGLGIDYEDEEVIVHLQLVNLGTLGTPETAAPQESQTAIATAKATNMNEAVFDIYNSAQRRIYWGHTTFIVISERALKAGKLTEVLDLINRFSQTRYRIQVYVTHDKDLVGILNSTPLFESSAIFTKLTDISNTYQQNSLVKPVSIRELIIMLDEPGHHGIIPTVRLNKESWQMDESSNQMIEIEGVSIVHKDEFQGSILHDDVNGLRWMQEGSERNDLTIMKDDKPASELVIVRPETNVKIETKGDDVIFHANIKATGLINAMLQNLEQSEIVKEAEKMIKEEVMKTFNKGLEINSDIYRLSEKLYRRDLKTWKKLEQDGVIPLNENSLKVEVEINLDDSKINKTEPIVE